MSDSDQLDSVLPDEDDGDFSEEESVAPPQSHKTHKKVKKVQTTTTDDTKKKGKTPKRLKITQAEQEILRDWLYENSIIWDKMTPNTSTTSGVTRCLG